MQNKNMPDKRLWHQARNIVIAFCVIVLALTSSSLWLNGRHGASDASDDSVESHTQETAEPSAHEAVATASASASTDQESQTQAQGTTDSAGTEWQSEPNVSIEEQDGMTGAVFGDGEDTHGMHNTSNAMAQNSTNTAFQSSTVADADASTVQTASDPDISDSTDVAFLHPEKSADSFAVEVGKFSGNRLIIGADSLSENFLSTNSVAGYDSIWIADYNNETDMRSDYKNLKAAGYDAVPDMSVQVCDNEHLEHSWLQKLKIMIRRILGSLIYAEDEKSLSEQIENLDSSNQTVALLDTGDNHAEAAVNLTKGTLADNNGHGTEMDSIIREKAGTPVNVVSIKTVDDDGKGRLSDLLTGIMLAKTVSPSAINISLSSSNEETADVVNSLIAKVASDDTAVVAAAGNQNSDASNYVPGNASSSITVGVADEDGNLQGDSNYGTKVNYYIDASSTSKAAAQFTGMYVNVSQTLADEEKKNDATTVTEEDSDSPDEATVPSSSPATNAYSTGLKAESLPESTNESDNDSQNNQMTSVTTTTEQPLAASPAPTDASAESDDSVNASPQPSDGANSDDEISTDAEINTEAVRQPVANVLRRMASLNLRTTANSPGATAASGTSDPDKKHATGYIESLDDDDEYIEMFKVLEQQDGTPVDHGNGKMWDDNDDPGNDSGPNNNVVMTYDTINYTLQLTSAPYTDGAYYRHGYIRFRMVLPASETEAQFVTGDMGWMVNGTGTDYDYKVVKETIDGKECQVLYCSMYLSADAAGTPNVFPCVKQTANVSIEVKNMKNGDYLQPKFYCWMDHNETNGMCTTHGKNEVMEADSGNIRISAKPSYNIVLASNSHNPTMTMDFSIGNGTAPNKELGKRHGTNFIFGARMELRNDGTCPNKMLKGVEAPTGDIDYTIDTSLFFLKADGSTVDITDDPDVKAVIYCVEPNWSNAMGRDEPSSPRGITFWPYGYGTGPNHALTSHVSYDYTADVLTMNLNQYTVNSNKFPSSSSVWSEEASSFYNHDDYGKGARYTRTGVFSAYQFDISLLYETQTLLSKYGTGSVGIKCQLKSISTTSLSGSTTGSNVLTSDDSASNAAPVHPAGSYVHMMTYEDYSHGWTWNVQGVGPQHYNQSDSVGIIGQKFRIGSLNANYDVESDFKLGDDRLVKFNAVAFTPLETNRSDVVFAAKKDGSDWIDDQEKSFAKIEDLVYYKTYDELVADGKKCVGVLFSWRKSYWVSDWTEKNIRMQINPDISLVKTVQSIETYSYVYHVDLTKHDLSNIAMVPTFREALASGQQVPTVPDSVKRTICRVGTYRKATYNTTTDIRTDSGTNDFEIGDSLYIENYTASITKSTSQTADGTTKTVFSLDNGEKIVDYSLSPYINMATPVNMNTEVTVTDTIPAGMVYNNDATYGGTYVKGVTDGAHGSVEDGTAIDAASTKITKNADGTTTVVWTLHNIDITKPIPIIRYSATIDVNAAVNGKNYTSKASVKTTEDQRSPSVANQNISDFTISVVKLSGFSLTKLPDKEIYEVPDDISWTMTWNNLSKNAEPDILMMDMMPYNGDSFGTDFHGSYTVKSLKLDLDGPSKYEFYYTTDESYRGKSTRDVTTDDARTNWKKGVIQSDGTVHTMDGITPVAWGIVGTLNENTSLQGHITIQTTGARPDDDYYNASSMMKAVVSGHSAYVSHNLAGYVFVDANKDGIKNGDEKVLSGVTATLYKKGDHTAPVKNIDGKECVAVTDEKGHYEFSNISKADYDVVFTKDDLGLYSLTPKSQDSADWTNKATHEVDNLKGIAQSMYIDNAIMRSVETQQRDVLSRITYRTDYLAVNLGVYSRTSDISILKTDGNNKPLPGAELVLTDKTGKTVDSWTSDSSAHKVNITWGEEYILKETKAPAGKSMLGEPVTLRINEEGKLIVNGSEASDYVIHLRDSALLEFLRAGGKGVWGFTIVGLVIMVIGAKLRKH